MVTAKIKQLPRRTAVKEADTWDLSSLFPDDVAWEAAFKTWEGEIPKYDAFRGTLGTSAAALAECLRFDTDFERAGERLGTYAFLKTAEDTANSSYQRMIGRYRNVASRAAPGGQLYPARDHGHFRPRHAGIPGGRAAGRVPLGARATLRYKPHTLSKRRREAAGHAERNGRHGQPGLSPIDRRRSEMGHDQERARRAGRAEPRLVLVVAALARPQRPQARLPPILHPVRRPRAHAGRDAVRLDPARRLLRPGTRVSERAWRPRCFPTRCRWRSTTI